jgi:hypothetical protein
MTKWPGQVGGRYREVIMSTSVLRKLMALVLPALLLLLPGSGMALFCSCPEAGSGCCQGGLAAKSASACDTSIQATAPPGPCECPHRSSVPDAPFPSIVAACCGQFAATSTALPDATVTSLRDNAEPHTASGALEAPHRTWRVPPYTLSVFAAPASKEPGSHLPAYLLFSSLLI